MRKLTSRSSSPERGQVLVMTALMMVVLIGIAGLAIDISAAYLREREERAIADAAALAGGQDLQIPGSRALPGADEYAAAKEHAMDVLVARLEASSPPTAGSCFTSAGCALPGTPYEVSIQTPSPSHVDCTPARCIQVAVRQPSFGLTFARIFGFDNWTVTSTSVAGIVQARQYGLVTLRPPDPRGGTANNDDIFITGGSVVTIRNADAGTNTNLVCSGAATGSALRLDPDFDVYHFDPHEAWVSPPGECASPTPSGVELSSPIDDPAYPIPQRTAVALGCPTTSTTTCTYTDANLDDAKLSTAACDAEIAARVPTQYAVDPANTICYMPGIYTNELVVSANTDVALLTPGVYFFDEGVDISGSLIGGYEAGQPGVALVLKSCGSASNCPFKGNNAVLVALNFGSAYQDTSGAKATAAQWAGGLVQTTTNPAVLMSVMVEPDPVCLGGSFPLAEPSNSCTSSNHTLKFPGNSNLWVAGVQYAPTDNTDVSGNRSTQQGVLGQIISWTITFHGGASLNLEAFFVDTGGVLRLDPACSPTRDSPPECNP
jgi:hypothetical protein